MRLEMRISMSSMVRDFEMMYGPWRGFLRDIEISDQMYAPDEPFAELVTMFIGYTYNDGPLEGGNDIYRLEIVNPPVLALRCANGNVLIGRHILIVQEFNPVKITELLRILVRETNAFTAKELGLRLERLALSEFQLGDYPLYPQNAVFEKEKLNIQEWNGVDVED